MYQNTTASWLYYKCYLHVHSLVYADASKQIITDQHVLTHTVIWDRPLLLLSSYVMQLSSC